MAQQKIYPDAVYEAGYRTGLSPATVLELFERGWKLEEQEGEPTRWVSPFAQLPAHIPHHEPQCKNECLNMAPHVHGLRCNRNCRACHGVCHPECPAYKKKETQ